MLALRLKAWTRNLFREPEPVPGGELIDFPRACDEQAEPLARPLSNPVPIGPESVPSASEPVPEPVPKLTAPAEPVALVHARALLELLRKECDEEVFGGQGVIIKASYVETVVYRKLLEKRGWRAQPWDGRHGVGKYLNILTGGKRSHNWETEDGPKKKGRAYRIAPAAETGAVVDLAERMRAHYREPVCAHGGGSCAWPLLRVRRRV